MLQLEQGETLLYVRVAYGRERQKTYIYGGRKAMELLDIIKGGRKENLFITTS
jgi:hypothetical protein